MSAILHQMLNLTMEETRFRIGDVVSVTDNASPYYADEGRILAVLLSKHGGTPVKYDVVFADGRSETFWDVQLKGSRSYES
jgi:hypothetical protein